MNWPFMYINLPKLAGKVAYARFLHDGSEVQFRTAEPATLHNHLNVYAPDDSLILTLPVKKPDLAVPVVELILK